MTDDRFGSEASGGAERGIYLDYNGSAPVDDRVTAVIVECLQNGVGNASAAHSYGRVQHDRVEEARTLIGELVGARGRNVVFTAGATEANNLAIKGLAASAPVGRSRVLVSAVEHASVVSTARWIESTGLGQMSTVPVTSGGYADLAALEGLLGDDVLMVSVMAANSETGVLNDIAAVVDMAHEAGALVHCDATQAVGRIGFDMGRLSVDAISFSGHKICGPGGVGALVATSSVLRELRPVIHGGGHERGLRSGSLNVAGIAGFGAAARIALAEYESESNRAGGLRDRFVAGVRARVSDLVENGDVGRRLANTTNLRFPGADNEAVLSGIHPVAASTGSACSSGTIEPSPVLLAMGLDRTAADESLRFSLGRFTTTEEIDDAIDLVTEAVKRVRAMNEID